MKQFPTRQTCSRKAALWYAFRPIVKCAAFIVIFAAVTAAGALLVPWLYSTGTIIGAVSDSLFNQPVVALPSRRDWLVFWIGDSAALAAFILWLAMRYRSARRGDVDDEA